MVRPERLIKLTRKLIKINSENPPGNEREIAVFVRDHLRRLGVAVKTYEFKESRTNVIGLIKGVKAKKELLISPHLDTVPAGKNWHLAPFSGTIKNGRIYGRGASDCKGNLAASLECINSIIEDKVRLNYNLVFAATADEECGSGLGLIPLLDKNILKPDYSLILDADEMDIIVAQKGLIHMKVLIQGKKAHGAYPWRGENAIDLALKAIGEIKKEKGRYTAHEFLRPPTINVGTIHGGDKVNMVADWCEFELDIRFLPGTRARQVLAGVKKNIRRCARKFKIEVQDIQKPCEIDKKHVLVDRLSGAIRSCGMHPRIKGSEGATVITFFQNKGIPAIAYGVGSRNTAHASDEYIDIGNLYLGTRILEKFLKTF
ncbi:MAG: M20 family metallopeptidase [Candidatus Omnitrophota bacterium]